MGHQAQAKGTPRAREKQWTEDTMNEDEAKQWKETRTRAKEATLEKRACDKTADMAMYKYEVLATKARKIEKEWKDLMQNGQRKECQHDGPCHVEDANGDRQYAGTLQAYEWLQEDSPREESLLGRPGIGRVIHLLRTWCFYIKRQITSFLLA